MTGTAFYIADNQAEKLNGCTNLADFSVNAFKNRLWWGSENFIFSDFLVRLAAINPTFTSYRLAKRALFIESSLFFRFKATAFQYLLDRIIYEL